ncbi:hypothetical protein BJX96DRAFT_151709 [Aspergillus floccosus]
MTDCNAGSDDCNFQCPHGGSWFVCESAPYFVGCCSSDPCHNTHSASPCPDVYPASFNQSIYDTIRPNNCIGSPSNNWYACTKTHPPFLGCCKSNPCEQTSGCPTDDLIQAAWSQSSLDQLEVFLDGASPTSTGDSQPTDSDSDDLSKGAIAGIAVGTAVAVIIILALAFFLFRQRRRRSRNGGDMGQPNMHADGQGPFYHAVSQQADSRLSASPGTWTSKHRASSSIGTSYASPTLVSDSRPLSEMYPASPSEDPSRWNQGLQIDGIPTSPTQAKFIPELDSTPNEVHELEGR